MSLWTDSLILHGEADEDVLADLRSVFPSLFSAAMGADGDDGGDDDADDDDFDDEDDDDSDDGDDDSDDDDEDDGDDEDGKSRRRKKPKLTARERRLQDENARRRIKQRKSDKRIQDLEAEVAKLTKGKPKNDGKGDDKDEDSSSAKVSELETKLAQQAKELAKYRRRDAVDDLARDYKVTDSKLLGYLLHEEDVELDEDGEWPEDIATIVKRIKRKNPTLTAKAGGKDDDDDEDDEDEKPRKPRVSSTGKGRRRTNKVDEKALAKNFPALSGRLR